MAKKKKEEKKYTGGKRKVSKKKKTTQTYKWLKQIYLELDKLKERLDLIEKFLGGRESMKEVVERNDRLKY